MTPLVSWLLNSIPFVLQLAVGVAGLLVTIGTRRRGPGTALLVTAFALMVGYCVGWIGWGFVVAHAPSIMRDNHLTIDAFNNIVVAVNDVLGVLEVVAWLMVVLGVLRARGRQPAPAGLTPFGAPGQFGPPATGPAGPPGRV